MAWSLAVIILALLAGLLVDGLPRLYRQRSCQGREWLRAFPHASKQEIRQFLDLFVYAFAFRPRHKLKFRPDDQILSLYRLIYPSRNMPDALELETLALVVERAYGLDLRAIWRDDLTLGELLSQALLRNSSVNE